MRKFCRDLNFTSPSHLKDIIEERKKIGPVGINKICSSLNLNNEEADFLKLLVTHNHCTNLLMKKKYSEKLLLRNKKIQFLLAETNEFFFRKRICAGICLLVNIHGKNFCADPLWVDRRLNFYSDLKDIKKSIDYLFSKQILIHNEGQYCLNFLPLIGPMGEKNTRSKIEILSLLEEGKISVKQGKGLCEFENTTAIISKCDSEELVGKVSKFQKELRLWLIEREQNSEQCKSENKIGVSVNTHLYSLTK